MARCENGTNRRTVNWRALMEWKELEASESMTREDIQGKAELLRAFQLVPRT